ncbi:two-component system, OmpR family, response regulator [Thalassobaculum litoreum DSM 18839]|uniref:Regulatory protein VirG n=2 Tax=Thalassobaculum TaxID=526215 RepID=A0A8G2EYK5_9PROT|nr:two-component system, OmpR family, response regulator [Thalassobaculum litoreum DSM 18839]
MLPDTDGLSLVREFKTRYDCGIIIVSGKGEAVERIVGLEIGADDYVTKPFEPRELIARVRSVLRRLAPAIPENQSRAAIGSRTGAGKPAQSADAAPVYEFEGWRLDTGSRTLSHSAEPVPLTTGEYQLLVVLLERAGRVLSRDQLLDFTHGDQTPVFDRSIDVQIGRIRTKIESDRVQPQIIKTIRNAGYMLAVPVRRI